MWKDVPVLLFPSKQEEKTWQTGQAATTTKAIDDGHNFIFHTKEHASSRLEAALCLLNLPRAMLRYLAGKKTQPPEKRQQSEQEKREGDKLYENTKQQRR